MGKPVLSVDWDGVIHSYSSGWKGADVVSDPPVDGAIDFLRMAVRDFEVNIFSSRSGQPGGIEAMQDALVRWTAGEGDQSWLTLIVFPKDKPPARVGIDDRMITFTGEWPSMRELMNFKPWNKQ